MCQEYPTAWCSVPSARGKATIDDRLGNMPKVHPTKVGIETAEGIDFWLTEHADY